MGTAMIHVKRKGGNTLQADGLDHRGFHLPHHILIKERTLKVYGIFETKGNILKREYRLMSESLSLYSQHL